MPPLTHAALMKTTLLDYPGEIASIIFTPGCNLRCPYCHNPSLVTDTHKNKDLLSLEDIKTFFVKRKSLIGAVVITGGEPLLFEDISEIVNFIKALGLKVKIDTNGLFPDRLKKLDVDYIAMDIKTSPENYKLLGVQGDGDKILHSINYILESGIDHEFRTTVTEGIVNESDITKLIPLLKNAKNWYFTPFQPGNSLNPSYNKKAPPSNEYMDSLNSIALKAGINSSIR